MSDENVDQGELGWGWGMVAEAITEAGFRFVWMLEGWEEKGREGRGGVSSLKIDFGGGCV